MTVSTHFRCLFAFLLTAVFAAPLTAGEDALYDGFRNPPATARPFVRWWWNGGCVTEAEALRELDVMHKAGIGGVEINTIGMLEATPATSIPALAWLSPEWNRVVKATVNGAKKHGMVVDMIVGSGWPFGGRFLNKGETIQAINVVRKPLTGPATFRGKIEQLMVPPASRHKVKPPAPPKLICLTRVPADITKIDQAVSLLDKVRPDGTVEFAVPAGKHDLYIGAWQEAFEIVTHGAPGADGPVLDHYNRTAVLKYLNRLSDGLGPVLGDKLGDGLRAMFCDSIELSGANWTTGLAEEFARRRGYDLKPWLPLALAAEGPTGDSPFADQVRRVRYDYSRTLVELFHENFILPFHQWCRDNGTLSRYQAYGSPWLMGMLDGYLVPDIPESDTWLFPHPPIGTAIDDIRYAVWGKYTSSGAHLAGRPVASCESMTNVGGVFQASLGYIKQADDLNFATGINHSVLHGFNYSPPQAGFPGWIRYGTYFSEQNTWWPYFHLWANYNARLSWVFQKARPVSQIAILGPTADVWGQDGLERQAFIQTPKYLHELWQAVHQNGYSADYVSEAVLQKATFEDGKLRCGTMTYDALLLADVTTLEPATATAIAAYAKARGTVIFAGKAPSRSPAMLAAAENDKAVRAAMGAAQAASLVRVGIVPAPAPADLLAWTGAMLKEFGLTPAVAISPPDARLFQVRHRLDNRDVFFFSNARADRAVEFRAAFNIPRATPWRWDPQTGERAVYPFGDRPTDLAIRLGPLESLLLVFDPDRDGPQGKPAPIPAEDDAEEINTPWAITFAPIRGTPFTRNVQVLSDLRDSVDGQLNGFAGVATYRTRFDAPETHRTLLSLGHVNGVSEVTLNGQALGVRWYGRHDYDVRAALQLGANDLEVKVTTVLYNYCATLTDNPVANHWTGGKKKRPLVSAGLPGPVRLIRVK